MEFGWYHELHRQVPGQSDADAFAMGLDQAVMAEEWGLDSFWVAEIHQQSARSVMSAPIPVLSALAGRTKRLMLGTGVQVLPLGHPLRLAEETATLDQISRGRLIFGVGRSGNPRSYGAYGVPYSESRERFYETLEVMKLAWSQETFSFHGQFHHFDDAKAVPRPYQKPFPEIRIGTNDKGEFVITNVPAGRIWDLYATMDSLAPKNLSARIVNVATKDDGQEVDVGDIVATPAYTLKGRVQLSTGEPIPLNMRLSLFAARLPDRQALIRHGVRNAAIPLIAYLGVQLVFLVEGVVVNQVIVPEEIRTKARIALDRMLSIT